jgi:hypothetical protein
VNDIIDRYTEDPDTPHYLRRAGLAFHRTRRRRMGLRSLPFVIRGNKSERTSGVFASFSLSRTQEISDGHNQRPPRRFAVSVDSASG